MEYVRNKKAAFEYHVEETIETGIELLGIEVKAIRAGHARLEGSHIIVRGGEAFVIGMHIDPYQAANTPEGYDPARTRRILLSKKEIAYVAKAEGVKGLTVIGTAIYSKGPKLKLQIAIVKGKKLHDKRETLKKRDVDRELQREAKVR
jgi:SsrA-binding protein